MTDSVPPPNLDLSISLRTQFRYIHPPHSPFPMFVTVALPPDNTTLPKHPDSTSLPKHSDVLKPSRRASLTAPVVLDLPAVSQLDGYITPGTAAKIENDHAAEAHAALAEITKKDQQCLLFPTYATRVPHDNNNSGDEWEIRVVGWAFAHNPASTRRKLMMGLARTVAGISRASDPATADNLESRLGYFFARNVRDQHFTIEVVGTSHANHMGIDADDPNPAEEQHLPADTMVPPSPCTPSASSDRTLFDPTGRGYDDDPFGETVAYVGGEKEAEDLLEQEIEDAGADLTDLNIAAQEPQSRRHHHHYHHHHHHYLHFRRHHRHDKKSSPDEEANTVTIDSTATLDYFHLPVPTTSSVPPSSNTSTSFSSPISSTNVTPASSTASIMITTSTSTSLSTATTGHFSGKLRVPTALVDEWGREQVGSNRPRLLKIRAFSSAADVPSYGLVSLIEPTGVSVISDIDDTIKDTQVLAGARVVLSNTFLMEAKEVPRMAEAYRHWYNLGASFHYVSNSPFQLLPMLQSFFRRSDFPPGSAHLRLYSGVFAKFTEVPGQAKRDRINEIMNDFPKRHFVLVGDSGEIDLEIYTRVALEYPDRIIAIFIRDVTTRAFLSRLDKERDRVQAQPVAALTAQSVDRTRSFPLSFSIPSGSGASSSSLVSAHSAPADSMSTSPVTEDLPAAWSPESPPLVKTPESEHFLTELSSRRQTQRSNSVSSTGERPSLFGITSLKRALWYERFEPSVPPPFPTSSMSTSTVTSTPTATVTTARSELLRSMSASSLSRSSSVSSGLSRSSTALSLVAAAAPTKNEVDILHDKIRKAKAELEGTGVKVVLFKEAEVLRESKEVEEALRRHGERKVVHA